MKNGTEIDAEFILSELMKSDWMRRPFCELYETALLKISGVECVEVFSKCFPVLSERIERLIASQIDSVEPASSLPSWQAESSFVDIEYLGSHGPRSGIRQCRAVLNAGDAYLYRDENNMDNIIAAYEMAFE